MFSIEAEFNDSDLEAMIQEDLQAWFDEITEVLMQTGKQQVDTAITKVTSGGYGKIFGNITYNLRSSMGCGLAIDGEVVEDYFPFGEGDEGQAHGKDLLNKIAAENNFEISLIVVAGEYYSEFVQAKGFDVDKMSLKTFEDNFFKMLNNG